MRPTSQPWCFRCRDEELRILRGELEVDENNISNTAGDYSDEDEEELSDEEEGGMVPGGFRGGDDLIIRRDSSSKNMQQMMGGKGRGMGNGQVGGVWRAVACCACGGCDHNVLCMVLSRFRTCGTCHLWRRCCCQVYAVCQLL